MRTKKYKVKQTTKERQELEQLTKQGKHSAAKIKRANILLSLDENQGPVKKQREIAAHLSTTTATIYTVSKQFNEAGLERRVIVKKPRGYTLSFAKVYPMLVQKAEKKERTKGEVDEIIFWLTGYDQASLQKQIDGGATMETFFDEAPRMNPNASLIKGVVCGVRVEEIEDETMQKIRWLDKMIDELAKGKSMEQILRK